MKQILNTNEKVTNQQLLTEVEVSNYHFHQHGGK